MNTKRRKFLSLLLALVLSVSALPISQLTAFALTSGDFEYSILSEEEKTCEISKYTGSETSVVIPNEIDGYTVTGIGYEAFYSCTFTNITIPDTVTSIDYGAFFYCMSLTDITIPNSVKNIGDYAFCYCASLTSIVIPEGVMSIGDYAFYYCASLASVNISNSVESIGNGAFIQCTLFENIEVDAENSAYSSINGVLFNKEQTKLICYPAGKSNTSYTVPDGVTSIGGYAFSLCTAITRVTISNSVISIGEYAFTSCTSLADVTIPDSVTSIGEGAFSYCISLTDIIIPYSVTTINSNAFEGCEKIKILGFNSSAVKTYATEKNIDFCLMGDTDGDGVYGTNDYAMLISQVFCQPVDTAVPKDAGDVNCDGAVDGFDAIQLDLYLNGVTDIHGNKIA